MITQETLNELLEDAKHTIVFVVYMGMDIPYTLIDVTPPLPRKDFIHLHNVITDQLDEIHISDIGVITTYTKPDGTFNNDYVYELVDNIKTTVEDCINDENITADAAKITAVKLDEDVCDYDFDILRVFDFKYTMWQLCNPSEETMQGVRENYMNQIRKHRETAFVELDQLEEESKQNGATQEDLDDIDTIKQMFRDIPQDVDVSKYKTIPELYTFWPSLLLPKPRTLLTKSQVTMIKDNATLDSLPDDFERDLNDITDYRELMVLLSDLGNLDDYDPGHITMIQNRIRFLQNAQAFLIQS